MIKNYFKIAWRNLVKNKFFSAINIIGLAIGMAACLIIMLFVFHEKSFDKFHAKNIYRLNEVQKFEGMVASQKVALTMFPMAPTMKNEFPEIKNYSRVSWASKVQMNYGDKRIYIPDLYFTDSTFLQLFDFKLIKGNRATALQKPNSILITQTTAEKLFGKEDPMGKTVSNYNRDTTDLQVTGILADVPENSQFHFDALVPISTIARPDWMDNWGGNWLNTYFELADNTNIATLEKKFPAFLKKYMAQGDNWKNYELFLLPLQEVHANANDIGLDYVNYHKFDKKYTSIFFVIAIVVLAIACINFMNLSTARSAERAREVGIRKSIGGQRFQIALQFLGETILLSLLALVFAICLVQLFLPFVNNLSQRDLSLPLFSNAGLLAAVLGGTIVVGIFSGLYPAAYLSSFQPVKVLKGATHSGKGKNRLRNILVVGQFTSAVFLIIATVFVVRQLRYMQQRDPGFDRDKVLTVALRNVNPEKYEVLKQDLSGNSMISAVTAAQDQLGSHLDQSGIQFKGDGPLRQLTSTRLIVDPDYLRLYKIPLLLGRNFSTEKSANGKEYIINEALASELLKDSPKAPLTSLLGRQFGFDSVGTIVGIARNFNFNSLHHKIETMFMFNQKEWSYNRMSVKIRTAKTAEAIAFVRSVWDKNFPETPFEYQFLDDHFEEVYRADTQVSRIVGVLAILSIIISCLGLFGLASYSAEKRIKEVGIRKVLGASAENIVSLLSIDFLKLVLIANLIAWPIAWFLLNRWLQDFAYRIPISWWVFIMAGIAAIVIALVTVSFQAIKAASANPVKSLRTE